MICTETANGIIKWLPEGNGFVVTNKKEFEKNVLPKYYPDSSGYATFTRTLNNYCFQSLYYGSHELIYKHFNFHYDKESILYKVQRNKIRNKKIIKKSAGAGAGAGAGADLDASGGGASLIEGVTNILKFSFMDAAEGLNNDKSDEYKKGWKDCYDMYFKK